MEGFCKIPGAADYCGLKPRAFRKHLKNGLRHVRLPSGTILVKYEWIDAYLAQFEEKENEVEEIVSEVIGGMKGGVTGKREK